MGGNLDGGQWYPDLSHFPKPVSRATASILVGAVFSEQACRRWGLWSSGVEFAVDDSGWVFVREPVIEDPSREDVDELAVQAEQTVAGARWNQEAEAWTSRGRTAVIDELRALQDEDLVSLDNNRLADHVLRVAATAVRMLDLHMELHLTDMLPLGALLHDGASWGLSPHEVIRLVTGASPASTPSDALLAARRAVAGAAPGVDVRSLPEVDAFLRDEGHHLVSDPDVAAPTLREHEPLLLRLLEGEIRTATADQHETATTLARDRVPPADRDRFDKLVDDARRTYGIRDDNTSLTAMWPLGLVRRAYLEAGRRLLLEHRDDVFSAEPAELVGMLTRRVRPGAMAATLGARTARRRVAGSQAPPPQPADPPPTPPTERLTDAQRWLHACLDAYGQHYEGGGGQPLVGIGVGGDCVTGRALVAVSPLDAIERLEPGCVLVVRATAPAYDAVLPLVGALVVETGGLLSHAAIASRELGLSAVIGVERATTLIDDGATVTVDPQAGSVVVVATASST